SEKKLREVTLESEHNRVQMRGLQQQFSRMEETVRNLLQSQGSSESNGEEPVTIIKTYQETLTQEGKRCKTGVEDICMSVDKDSSKENSSTEEEKAKMKLLLERLKALEAENSALAMENENQREQYERCLDEVANQVVQALLTQKDLREECLKLKTRVFDLEQQNRTLSVLFQQRMRPTSGLLLQVKVVTENFPEDEDDTITDSTCQNHLIESCCQMRTLDSGIGTFPLPDSGNRSTGRHVSKQELDLETHNFPSPGHAFPHTAYEKAKTLEREVPSTTDKNEGSVESIISHSASDPTMTAKSLQPFQSRLPKPASAVFCLCTHTYAKQLFY
uniref:NCK associated protein 5 n=1 Tax=Anolis carolinensis TaxID=28377 RepID=H9GJM6_ANOCA